MLRQLPEGGIACHLCGGAYDDVKPFDFAHSSPAEAHKMNHFIRTASSDVPLLPLSTAVASTWQREADN
jgi:hypothetical protein